MADPDAFCSYLLAAWAISNNPKLASVALLGFSCNNNLIARTLIRALSGLRCLNDFYLEEVDHKIQVTQALRQNFLNVSPP